MKTRVTIVAENDKPLSALGDNPNEKVRMVWELMLNLIALQSGETVRVEKAEAFEDEPRTYVIHPQKPTNDEKCFECDDFFTCDGQCDEVEDEPQTELVRVKYHCINCAENGSYKCSKCDGEMYYKYDKDEPQTDCGGKL